MKHCYFLLVFSLFFYFAVGFDPEEIWTERHPYAKDAQNHTPNCSVNMRLFGPNNKYRCNCKNLQACDFSKNGKCNDNKCITYLTGQFCQKINYHDLIIVYLDAKERIYGGWYHNSINSYRINLIKVHCKSADPQNFTFTINRNEFCTKKCSENTTCTGDQIGSVLNITITGNNPRDFFSKIEITGCSPFWFGKNCDKQCHCENNEDCHKITGKCPNDCEKGRSGPDCQKLNYENVAMNKPVSQNTIYPGDIMLKYNSCMNVKFDFSANLAVDGNIDQQQERHSCMHTKQGYSRWSVDLGKKYNISQIRIYNRNINTYRMRNAVIKVGNQKCYEIREAKKIYDIKCDSVIAGENITIERRDLLNFCEVEVLQCLTGFYGDRCSKICSNCKHSSCDQWTGRCISGCVPGYWQSKTQLCTVCSPGKFGENCTKICRCKNNTYCTKETGICKYGGCETGYQGESCQEPCSPGKFGENCTKICRCKNNTYCTKETGICKYGGCETGYQGESCQELCPDGKFGEGCLQTCHCKNNTYCNKKIGTCGFGRCEAGYKGYNCQERKLNIFITIVIIPSVLLVIISGIAIYFKIRKSKRKEDKTSASGPSVERNFVEHNEEENPEQLEELEGMYIDAGSMETSTYEVIKDNDDEEENPEPLNEQESMYIDARSMETSTCEVIKDNDDEEDNPEPLEELKGMYIDAGSMETSTYEVIKDNDDEEDNPEPLNEQESMYIDAGSMETSTCEVIKDNDDEEDNPEPLNEQESMYIDAGSMETSTCEVIKDNDDEEENPEQQSIYTELF